MARQIDAPLDSADVILLLVSRDFLAADYCYDVDPRRAMERHETGEVRVTSIILARPTGRPRPSPSSRQPRVTAARCDLDRTSTRRSST
ncbi:MAG: hypothetical protein M3O34_12260 [Chloroflexota bacterium]|nr:hypothetical protein [Chloroflexota bacterium]